MYLTREQSRAVDRRATEEFGMPSLMLMENAGRGAVELLLELGIKGRVLVCCGKGNNGGDGFVMARHLDNRKIAVAVRLFARPEELTGDAAVNHEIVRRMGLPLQSGLPPDLDRLGQDLARSEWVVDALFGTGLAGAIRAPLDAVVEAINTSSCRVLAVDIPSGLDCDTGLPLGPTLRAHHTVTFVAAKAGFQHARSREWTGEVHIVGIGAPRVLAQA